MITAFTGIKRISRSQALLIRLSWLTDHQRVRAPLQTHTFFWRKPNAAYQHKHLIPTVKHGDGGMMIWGSFCSHRTWTPCSQWVHHELLYIPKYSRVKCEAICLTAKAWLKLGHQQDNDPKHSSKSTTECVKKKRIKVLQWSSQTLDLTLAEMLWWDLKRAVHKPMLKSSKNWTNVVKKSGEKFLLSHVPYIMEKITSSYCCWR